MDLLAEMTAEQREGFATAARELLAHLDRLDDERTG
jgi:hypothetical protein